MNQAASTDDTAGRLAGCELVMVTYHSRRHVEALLPVLPEGCPLVVVDNAQGADGLEDLLADRVGTRYLHGPARGFAAAANLGARTSSADYLLFINPDSRPTPDVLAQLVDDLRSDPHLGAVAGLMVGHDGRAERGVGGYEFTLGRALIHAAGLHHAFKNSGLYVRPAIGQPVDVEWVTGACLAVPRTVFLQVNGFDESFFVYCEDVDFGNRLRSNGYGLRLRVDLPVAHGAGSSGAPSTVMHRLKGAAFALYVRRRNGQVQGNVITAAMVAGFTGRLLLCLLLGRREVAKEHAAYLRGLVLGRGGAV